MCEPLWTAAGVNPDATNSVTFLSVWNSHLMRRLLFCADGSNRCTQRTSTESVKKKWFGCSRAPHLEVCCCYRANLTTTPWLIARQPAKSKTSEGPFPSIENVKLPVLAD